ncbi:unnamed protein product [Rhizoctonia solani]|uniref:Uncharacterized protein n=1 Tax=Rhizoctonia solani TaxID=456999 RepID=A0A8H3HHD5_9AGAM|nr:unnamed protein product [Rhizoctonia solani]
MDCPLLKSLKSGVGPVQQAHAPSNFGQGFGIEAPNTLSNHNSSTLAESNGPSNHGNAGRLPSLFIV